MMMVNKGKPQRRTNTTVLIVTNGELTEMTYLKKLKQMMRSHNGFTVTVREVKGDPMTIIKKLSNPCGDTSGFNEVWIVVDEDGVDRTSFVSTCAKKRKPGKWFGIVSRPCFEVWLIAHYEQVRNYQDQNDAQEHFNKLASKRKTNKHLPDDFPFDSYRLACDQCQLQGAERVSAGELPPSPGTGMEHLVRRLLPVSE